MVDKEVVLDTALFLDSSEALPLLAERKGVTRTLVEAFLRTCYEDLGKQPRHLDEEDMRVILGRLLPERLAPRDPLAEHVPEVLWAYLDHLETVQVVHRSFELRRALEAGVPGFLEAVRSREVEEGTRALENPFVHGAPKLGRNDPCSCGSGKKFKKCHGKEA